ncbi:hypothetical protein [Spirosoma linguale]|uniref:HTH cro/C1-type domain-containing protein n=1 Tax=Spirosoma linguale (strain ATCC 33905 / DSM 74 / LMG 10896 / Claus 1) TaxID=504472 RepID=D2QGZ4_SPILD|nr:hypothetical protein Slin_0697 [Spirosoma linguale DSM 74]
MEHHGKRLKGIAKDKGYDIQQLAEALDIHRVTIEKDFKAVILSRKRLRKYETLLGFSSNEFYIQPEKATSAVNNKLSESAVIALYEKLLQEKDERIKLLQHQVRFFPSAAQMV